MKSDIDIKDIFFFMGLVMIGVGIWFFDWRISLIVIGAILSALGFMGLLKRGR
jgi:hypothetical protein